MKRQRDFTTIDTMRFQEWQKTHEVDSKFARSGVLNDVKFALQIRPHWSGGRPYNNAIETPPGGRHVLCLRKARAGSAPVLSLRERTIAPSSRLIATLYGPMDGLISKTKIE